MYIYIYTIRYSHLLKQLVLYSHANPWLWRPLIIHQGNRNCRLPRHRCTISSCHAPPRTPPTQERCHRKTSVTYANKLHTTHAHTHTHSQRAKYMRHVTFYATTLPTGCADSYLATPPAAPRQISFTRMSWHCLSVVSVAGSRQLSSWAKVTLPSPQG